MSELHPSEDPTGKRFWAAVRLGLGIAQMTSAVGAFLLIARTGFSRETLVLVLLTCLFTTTSVLLFGHREPPKIR